MRDKNYKCSDCGESKDINDECYCDIADQIAFDAFDYVERAHKKLEEEGLPLPETEIFIAGALYMRMKMFGVGNE